MKTITLILTYVKNKFYSKLKKVKQSIRLIITYVISLQLIFANISFAQSNTDKKYSGKANQLNISNTQEKIKSLYSINSAFNANPLVEQIMNSEEIDPSLGLQKKDLDTNPFFMRSQKWYKTTPSTKNTKTTFQIMSQNHIRIDDAVLSLPLDLTIVQVGLNAIYLTAKESVFKDKDLTQNSGGIFYINKMDLLKAKVNFNPVAIMFLPLPGMNWSTEDKVIIQENQILGQLVIANKNEFIPFELKDIKILTDVQMTNLMLSQALALTSQAKQISKSLSIDDQPSNKKINLPFILPARGSTAGFGTLFTGQDIENNRKLFKLNQKDFSQNFYDLIKSNFIYNATTRLSGLFNLMFPTARAIDFNTLSNFEITSPAIAKLVYVSSIMGVLFVSSVVLKYTILRTRMEEIEKYQNSMKAQLSQDIQFQQAKSSAATMTFITQVKEKSNQLKQLTKKQYQDLLDNRPTLKNTLNNIQTMTQNQLSALRKDVDILAHLLTMSGTIASFTVATAIEYFGDRYAKSLFAADNMMIRKILNYSVYYSRANAKKVPVNTKTLWLGAVVMGAVDTYFVSVQINTLVPWLSSHLKPAMPDFIDRRITQAFEVPNEDQARLVRESVLSNGVAWARSGASQYSSEAKYQYYAATEREVKDLLQKQGIDPDKPENQHTVEKMIEEKLNLKLKKLGLPDTNEYIVGVDTLFDQVFQKMGFRLSANQKQNGQHYYLEARPGLAASSLKNAIRLVDQINSEGSLQQAHETREILTDTLKSFSILRSSVRAIAESVQDQQSKIPNFQQTYQQVVELRQSLVILSHNGALDFNHQELVPQQWKNRGYSITAMKNAAYLFRAALIGTLNDDHYILNLSASKVAEIRKNQLTNADLKNDSLERILTSVDQEYKNQTQERIANQANSYEFTLDQYQKKVHQSAKDFAQEVLFSRLQEAEKSGHLISEQDRKSIYLNAYTEQAASEVQLYYDDKTNPQLLKFANEQAAQLLETALDNDQKLKTYLTKQNQSDQLAIMGFYYANSWLVAYNTGSSSLNLIPPTSPDQPGRFQKLRRTEVVRNSPFFTRALRAVEALYDNESFRIEKTAHKNATTALRADLISSLERTLRIAPLYLTTSYLYNSAVWNVSVPYGSYVVGLFFVFSIIVPSQLLNRMFVLQGIEPMGGLFKKIGFGILYSFVTFFPMFPESLFGPDMAKALDKVGEKVVMMTKAENADQRQSEIKAGKIIAIPGTTYTIRIENKCRSIFLSK